MFLYASSFPELIIKCFERRRKNKKKNPRETRGCSSQCSHQHFQRPSQIYQCLHRCPAVLLSGQALPPAPPQLTAAPGTGLGDFLHCSCSQNNQQGWLNQVEGPLFPCSPAWGTKGRNSARFPAWGHGWRSLWRSPSQHQRSHANSIYQVTATKYSSQVMLTKRKTHIPVFTATCTAVSRTGVFQVRKSNWRDPWHRHSWIAHTQVKKKNTSKPQKLHCWSCG